MEILLPLHDGGQVGGGIKSSSVGFPDDAGRQLLGICLLRNIHHQGSLALIGQALFHKIIDHGGDIGLGVAFALP